MKPAPSIPALLTAALLFCGEIPTSSGQDVTPTLADDAIPLEKAPERLKQIHDDFAQQAKTFVDVVEAEAAAKRITDTVARLLTTLTQIERFNFSELSRNLPQDNETIVTASRELDAASRLFQVRMNAVANGLMKELVGKVKDAVLGNPKPEEVAVLAQTIGQLQGTMERKGLGTATWTNQSNITFAGLGNLAGILDAVKQLSEAENQRSDAGLSAAATALRNQTSRGELLTREEVQRRISRALEPLLESISEQEDAIEKMIADGKPGAEIAAAVEKYRQSIKRFQLLSGGEQRPTGADFSESTATFYKYIATALKSLESGEFVEVDRSLKNAINLRQQLESSNHRDLGPCVAKVEKELSDKVAVLCKQGVSEVATRIAAAKEPSDINGILNQIHKLSKQILVSDEQRSACDFRLLVDPLTELQRAWSSSSPQMVARQEQMLAMTRREIPEAFDVEFAALRNRILRDVLAVSLKTPELKAEPYAAKPPEAAVEALCSDLAKQGEWRRVLDILQLRGQFVDQRENASVTAISSFLTGCNSELAEQWVDAISAYKSVLRSTAPLAPVKSAADRIKAIAKDHPEAFREAENRGKNNDFATP